MAEMTGNKDPSPSEHPDGGSTLPPSGEELSWMERLVGNLVSVSLVEPQGEPLTPGSTASPEAPSKLGRYRVLREVGRGGIGIVYRVRDDELGRDLALKVLRDPHNPGAQKRFIEEAQIGGQLQHPGIVPVHELGLIDGVTPYFAMKLVKGDTLATLLERRQEATEDRQTLLSVFEQICQTLAYAHARGVIHRDLKPANIMVGTHGQVQVMDWGLSKVLQEGGVADERRARRTHAQVTAIHTVRTRDGTSESLAGSVMGTPAYMPPEQAEGDVDDLDERADVFGLGAILCEILTGKPPYTGKTIAEIHRKAREADLGDALQRLEASRADPELIDLARRCLSPEPRARPREAGGVARVLREYFDTMDRRARNAELAAAEASERLTGARRARRLTLAIGATVVLALAAGGGGFLVLERFRQDRAERAAGAVEVAIAEATALRGEADGAADAASWDRALAAAERAVSLAGDEAGEAARSRARELRDRIAVDRDAVREQAERAARERAIAGRLVTLDWRQDEPWTDRLDALNVEFERGFRELGIDVPAQDAPASAALVRGTTVSLELARALDGWGRLLRKLQGATVTGWKKQIQIAREADPDPLRVRIRQALLEANAADLKTLAAQHAKELPEPPPIGASVGPTPQPPTAAWPSLTVELLAAALQTVGELEAARSLLEAALPLDAGNAHLHHRMLLLHLARSPPDRIEAYRHATALVALRKDDPHAWLDRARIDAMRGLDPDEAVEGYVRALALPDCEPEAWAELAFQQIQSGDDRGAIASYQKLFTEAPQSEAGQRIDIQWRLGECLWRTGKAEEALAVLRAAHQRSPGDQDLLFVLGSFLEDAAATDRGLLAEAARIYSEWVTAAPRNPDRHYVLGRSLLELGDWRAAADALSRGARLAAEDPTQYFYEGRSRELLGVALGRLGDLDSALAELAEADRLDPPQALIAIEPSPGGLNPGPARSAASRERRRRHLEAARDLLAAIVERKPDAVHARVHLAIRHLRLGEVEKALQLLRAAASRQADSPLARGTLGLAQLAGAVAPPVDAARLAEARASLEKALQLSPATSAYRNTFACVLESLGRRTEAIAELRRATRADVRNVTARLNLGIALLAEERTAQSLEELEPLAELRTERLQLAFVALSEAQSGAGQPLQATASAREALRLDGPRGRALADLSFAELKLGRLDAALAHAREAVALEPLDPRAHHILGEALADRGELDAAIDAVRQALRLRPDCWRSAVRLGQLHRRKGEHALALDAVRRAIEAAPTRDDPIGELRKLLEDSEGRPTQRELGPALDDLVRTLDGLLSGGGAVHPDIAAHYLSAWLRSPQLPVKTAPAPLARALVTSRGGQDPRAAALLARVLTAGGARAEAVAVLEQAQAASSDPDALREDLASARAAVLPDLVSFASIDAAIEQPTVLLARNASWRHLSGHADPSPGLAWTQAGFDDSGWRTGKGPFGFTKPGLGTVVEDLLGRTCTLYLRTSFLAERIDRFRRLELSVMADDGCVVYLDGKELHRVRAGAAGTRLAHDAQASASAVDALPEETVEIDKGLLAGGEHLLAVQALNSRAESFDLYLSVELRGELEPGEDAARFAAFRAAAAGDDAAARLRYLDARLAERQGDLDRALATYVELLPVPQSQAHVGTRLAALTDAADESGLRAREAFRTHLAKLPRLPLLMSRAPAQPVGLAPPPGAQLEGRTVTLEASPFFSLRLGEQHRRSRWWIRAEGESFELNPTFEDFVDGQLTAFSVPPGLLAPRTRYFWKVAYQGESSALSSASREESFVTADFPLTTVPIDLTAHFNVDVVADPGDDSLDSLDDMWALALDGYDGTGEKPDVRGIPRGGRVGAHRLGPPAGPNAIRLGPQDPDDVRLEVPVGRYQLLRVLTTGVHQGGTVVVRLEYAEGPSGEASLQIPDWFQELRSGVNASSFGSGVSPVLNGLQRFHVRERTVEGLKEPALFEALVAPDAARELRAVTVLAARSSLLKPGRFTGGMPRVYIFALTGARADG